MNQNFENINDGISYEEIDLRDLIKILYNDVKLITLLTLLSSMLFLFYSLTLPNIYTSKVLLAPHVSGNSMSNAMRNAGNLASLAGVNILSDESDSNTQKAKAKITSLSFFEDNIINQIYLPELMAVKSWDSSKNELLLDPTIFNESSESWVGIDMQTPSIQESHKKFADDHLSFKEDKSSGFFTLKISHQSPFVAKKWAELYVNEINSFYRKQDKERSSKSISYINTQLEQTNLAEVKQVMANLLQNEMQKLILIEANDSYVFEIIDPPAIMERKSSPNRLLIILTGSIIGFLFSTFFSILRYFFS